MHNEGGGCEPIHNSAVLVVLPSGSTFYPAARCRGRTGPQPEVLEKSRAFGSTGAWRQFIYIYLTCDTARGQRYDEA